MRRILVRYLPTPEGRAALRAAVTEARERSAELLLFRHIQVSEEGGADDVADARTDLEVEAANLRDEGIRCDVRWSVGSGAAVRALLHQVERDDVDLIVIGVPRRSPVGKLVLGSTTQDIILRAERPILAVKAPPDPFPGG
jgi:nucleotide-binding universal stress UspA family protein